MERRRSRAARFTMTLAFCWFAACPAEEQEPPPSSCEVRIPGPQSFFGTAAFPTLVFLFTRFTAAMIHPTRDQPERPSHLRVSRASRRVRWPGNS